MPFEKFEFTDSSQLIAKSQEKVTKMLNSGDPNQIRAANTKSVLDAFFGTPEIRKAKKTEEIVAAGMALEQNEDESYLDYQIRQQKQIQQQAARVDPSVAVQANQHIATLLSEKRERGRIEAKDERERVKHDWAIKKEEMKQTPTIEQLNPENGQWESIMTGEYGKDTFEKFNDTVKELNGKGGQYRVSSEAEKYTIEEFEASDDGFIELPTSVKTETISGYKAVTNTMESFNPLVNLLENEEFALQGIEFDKHGQLLKGESNTFFGALQDAGEQVRSGLDAFDQKYMTEEGTGEVVDTVDYVRNAIASPEVAESLKARGIAAGVAQGIIIDIGYALAKMRDDGRLSDQDVSLAIRSLTGKGSIAEIGELLNVQVNKARVRLRDLNNTISKSPGVIPPALIEQAEKSLLMGQDMVIRLRKRAEQEGQPTHVTERGGLSAEAAGAIDTEYGF